MGHNRNIPQPSRHSAIPAGEVIFSKGDTGGVAIYVVVEGEVDLLVKGRLVESLGPGGVLGAMALLDKVPRRASAVAKTAKNRPQARRDQRKAFQVPGAADAQFRIADDAGHL